MRVVSLVPSLTETLFLFGPGPAEIVGRTRFCVAPEDRVLAVPALGGTKDPDLDAVLARKPDLVLLDREENRRRDFEALRAAGIATFVSDVRKASDVPGMLLDLGLATGTRERAGESAAALRAALDAPAPVPSLGPVLPLIWKRPLMALSPGRYGGDLLQMAGFRVADPEPGTGYPKLEARRIAALGVVLLLLLSEPYPFTQEDGEEIADEVVRAGGSRPRCVAVDGQDVTWFGARTGKALLRLRRLREQTT